MQLHDIQARFRSTVLGDHDAVGTDNRFISQFVDDDIGVTKRLHYYRDSVLEKLIKVLAITYPTIEGLVGNAFFKQVARLYVRANPPKSGDLNFYGDDFPNFLTTIQEAQHLPYLYDAARLDWIYNAAYYAPDDQALSVDKIQSIDQDALAQSILKPRSSLFLMQSPYPVHDLRAYVKDPDNTPQPDFDKGAAFVLVYRPHITITPMMIDAPAFTILTHLVTGKMIANALEQTLQDHPDFNFGAFLNKFILNETFSDLIANS